MGYYEPYAEIPANERDISRAITSLMEELEAIDYYNQRAFVSSNSELVELIIHNRNEEIEHASMLIEFLRRHMPVFDTQLRRYLFTEAPLTAVEAGTSSSGNAPSGDTAPSSSIRIGSLK